VLVVRVEGGCGVIVVEVNTINAVNGREDGPFGHPGASVETDEYGLHVRTYDGTTSYPWRVVKRWRCSA
jgi:hypothetical protein